LAILGVIGIARPFYGTIASTLAFGWLFVTALDCQSISGSLFCQVLKVALTNSG
jgi:hypothetical protein